MTLKNLLIAAFSLVLFSCSKSSNHENSTSDTSVSVEEKPMDALDTTGGKGVFFVELKDSQGVMSPLLVKMGVNGMQVEKAGAINSLSGHHHLIIDGDFIEEKNIVPLDDTHLHFGQAQTETEIKLTPGYHKLTLQFANGVHSSYGGRWSKSITVLVK